MVTLTKLLTRIDSVNVLVIGDLLFDVYTKGKVNRISPEAPVPVLHVSEISKLPGGAGNVALNLKALGANVSLISRIGNDRDGKHLLELLEEKALSINSIFTQKNLKTFVKNRFIAEGQQLIRADYEEIEPLSVELEEKIKKLITEEILKYNLIAVSDYGKGLLSESLLEFIIFSANKNKIPIIVDPKGTDFTKYHGAFLLKPNNKEAFIAAGCEEEEPIEVVAKKIFEKTEVSHLLITRSEKGMILFSRDLQYKNFPVMPKDVIDVTGAGDTALAMLAMGLANELSFDHTIELANIASSIAIERLGCANIKFSEVAKILLKKDPINKIISDENQIFILEKATEDLPLIYVFLEEKDVSTQSLHWIKEIAGDKAGAELIVHVKSKNEEAPFIQLLASLPEIDYVLVVALDKKRFVKRLKSTKVYNFKDSDKYLALTSPS